MRIDDRENLYDAVLCALDEDALIDRVRTVLRTPSLSGEEEEVALLFTEAMTSLGMKSELQPVPANSKMAASYNAIGRLAGSGGGRALLFSGHTDHNPVVDGWTHDPFGGEIVDGWIYGFVHMKAAGACYLAAVDAVQKAGVKLKGDIILAYVCGELRGGTGTQHALANGLTADWFVLGEPTELQLATCHCASQVVKVHVLGHSKHFATEEVLGLQAVNAVEVAARVISALGGSHRPLKSRERGGFLTFTPQPGFEGLPQLNVGAIRGGLSRSYNETRPALYPDVCTITIDLRLIPGMSRESVHRDLMDFMERFEAEDEADVRWQIEFADQTFPIPFSSPSDSPVVRAIAAAHRRVHGIPPQWSKVLRFAASDASWMQAAGIPGVIYGPTGRYLSRPNERCEIADLVNAARTYACVMANICGAHSGA
jgi:acetylornithine deacetylase